MSLKELQAIATYRVPTAIEFAEHDSVDVWERRPKGANRREGPAVRLIRGLQAYCQSPEWSPIALRNYLATKNIRHLGHITQTHTSSGFRHLHKSLGSILGWSANSHGPEARAKLIGLGVYSLNLADYADPEEIIHDKWSSANPTSEYFNAKMPPSILEVNQRIAAPSIAQLLQANNAVHLGHIVGQTNITLARLYGILPELNPTGTRVVKNAARKILITSRAFSELICEYPEQVQEEIQQAAVASVSASGKKNPVVEYFIPQIQTLPENSCLQNQEYLRNSSVFRQTYSRSTRQRQNLRKLVGE